MSKTLINYFVDSLQRAFAGPVWYGSTVNEILNRVVDGNVRYASKHNLGEILEHMIAWKEYGIQKLQDNETYTIELGSEADWKSGMQYSIDEIGELIETLRAKQTLLISLLESKTDDWLNQNMAGKVEYSNLLLVEGLLQHDIYHTSQIAMLLPIKK